MKLFILGSLAFDEIGQFHGDFRELIRPELMDKLSISFIVDDPQRYFGGCAGNLAYGLGLLKRPAYICSLLGSDGTSYKTRLEDLGMLTDFLELKEGNTAKAMITTNREGAQIAQFNSGVSGCKASAFVLPSLAQKGDIFLVGPENHYRMLQAAEQAKKWGLRVFLDLGQLLHTFSQEELRTLVEGSELLLLNDYEWTVFLERLQSSPEEILKKLSGVVLTHGKDGVDFLSSESSLHVSAHPASPLVDPTGAGDAFRAGFLASLLKNTSQPGQKEHFESALKCGAVLGAACVAYPHAQDYLLNPDQVRELKKLGFE